MQSNNITNLTLLELNKIKGLYYIWYDDFLSCEKVKREQLWRIEQLNLKEDVQIKKFEVDVTDFEWGESSDDNPNGAFVTKDLIGFIPKLNEFAESYFNEMIRRPIVFFVETFENGVFLLGGTKPKSKFNFRKVNNKRSGYEITISCLSIESSLVIDDEDYFNSPPVVPSVKVCVNGVLIRRAFYGEEINVIVRNQDDEVVVPDAVTMVGDDIFVQITEAEPVGVHFDMPFFRQWQSFASYDTGFKKQANWDAYTPPANPKVKAQLDDTLGANQFFRLKDDLVVNGVASKIRFVDVDGGQTFSATGSKNELLIDKLCARMVTRLDNGGSVNQAAWLGDSQVFSITVGGVVYNDWELLSAEEALHMFGFHWTGSQADPISGVTLCTWLNIINHTSTTNMDNTAQSMAFVIGASGSNFQGYNKTSASRRIYVRRCDSLITAP